MGANSADMKSVHELTDRESHGGVCKLAQYSTTAMNTAK